MEKCCPVDTIGEPTRFRWLVLTQGYVDPNETLWDTKQDQKLYIRKKFGKIGKETRNERKQEGQGPLYIVCMYDIVNEQI